VKKMFQSISFFIFPAAFAGLRVLNTNPTLWPDGAIPLPMYFSKYINLKLVNYISKIYNLTGMEWKLPNSFVLEIVSLHFKVTIHP
jgi:hypothetical protein